MNVYLAFYISFSYLSGLILKADQLLLAFYLSYQTSLFNFKYIFLENRFLENMNRSQLEFISLSKIIFIYTIYSCFSICQGFSVD